MNVLLALRIPKNLLVLPLEVVLLYFGMKMVLKIYMALPGTAGDACAVKADTTR